MCYHTARSYLTDRRHCMEGCAWRGVWACEDGKLGIFEGGIFLNWWGITVFTNSLNWERE